MRKKNKYNNIKKHFFEKNFNTPDYETQLKFKQCTTDNEIEDFLKDSNNNLHYHFSYPNSIIDNNNDNNNTESNININNKTLPTTDSTTPSLTQAIHIPLNAINVNIKIENNINTNNTNNNIEHDIESNNNKNSNKIDNKTCVNIIISNNSNMDNNFNKNINNNSKNENKNNDINKSNESNNKSRKQSKNSTLDSSNKESSNHDELDKKSHVKIIVNGKQSRKQSRKQSKNNIVIMILLLLITTQYTPLNDLHAKHVYVYNTCLQAHNTPLEHVFILYEYLISPPFLYTNYIGCKRHHEPSPQNSRKKNKSPPRRIEKKTYTNIVINKNPEIIILSWHGQQEVWSKWNYYSNALSNKGHQFRHDDGKDQAQFAWLASNKIRKKTQHFNAG